jgi:hypothetical protein
MMYGIRLLLGAFELLFFSYVISAEPWRISHTDPQNFWAAFHTWLYAVLAACVIVCPLPRLLAVLCVVGAVALPVTGSWARLEWLSGNDGGGFFWLLVVGPVCLLISVGNLLLGMALWKVSRKTPGQTEDGSVDLEAGHGIKCLDRGRNRVEHD